MTHWRHFALRRPSPCRRFGSLRWFLRWILSWLVVEPYPSETYHIMMKFLVFLEKNRTMFYMEKIGKMMKNVPISTNQFLSLHEDLIPGSLPDATRTGQTAAGPIAPRTQLAIHAYSDSKVFQIENDEHV